MPKHLILVGAVYLDTMLDIPVYPKEDAKQRASNLDIRFGGNGVNSLRVLQSILRPEDDLQVHLVSCLPSKDSTSVKNFMSSFGGYSKTLSFESCIFREGYTQPARSYIIRSEETGSRTIVNHNDLPEMTVTEFEARLADFAELDKPVWWHFEGRIPDITQTCIQRIRSRAPRHNISVEIEKPGREGLPELSAMADVVFYSRSWAEHRGYESPEACLKAEANPASFNTFCTWGAGGAAALDSRNRSLILRETPQAVQVVDAVGAGDTFVAGILFCMLCHQTSWTLEAKLRMGVSLATAKVQQHGFEALQLPQYGI